MVRRAEILIGRLAFHKKDSLFTARRIKEASLERKAQRAAERSAAVAAGTDPEEFDKQARLQDAKDTNAQLLADPFEYFGHGPEMYKLTELVDAVNLLQRQVVAIVASSDEALPDFIPSWRPGDEITLPDEHAGAVVLDDLDGFDPVAMGLT